MNKNKPSFIRRLRDRHERFDDFCFWFYDNWETLVIRILGGAILILFVILAVIMCSSCSIML